MNRTTVGLPLLFCALFGLGCDGDKTGVQPSPPITSDASAPPLAAPRRQAFHRNPFGDAFQSDNLMVDGDFELTGRNDQAPWLVFDPSKGQQTLDYDTGGHCRSGVRCATLAPPDALIGSFASPVELKMLVKLYAKLTSQHCKDLSILVMNIQSGDIDKSVNMVATAPAADGWCVYEGTADNLAYKAPVLYISTTNDATATIDEVSVLPLGETPVHGAPPPLGEVDAATRARASAAAAWIRGHRNYGRRVTRGPA